MCCNSCGSIRSSSFTLDGFSVFYLVPGGLLHLRMHLITSFMFSNTHSQYLLFTTPDFIHGIMCRLRAVYDLEDGSCQTWNLPLFFSVFSSPWDFASFYLKPVFLVNFLRKGIYKRLKKGTIIIGYLSVYHNKRLSFVVFL